MPNLTRNLFSLSIILLSMMIMLNACSTGSEPEVYSLTAIVVPAEAGTVTTADTEAVEGGSIQVVAVPNEHWEFLSWGGDLPEVDQPTVFVYMDRNRDIVAKFEKVEYPLTVTVEGEGTVEQELISSKTTDYQHGSLIGLRAVPEHGWEFIEWGGDASGTDPEIEVEVEDELNITAEFARKDYELTVEIVGQGEVSQEVVPAKTQDYPFETMVQLTAQPASNWVFSNWSGDVEGTEDSKVVEISENLTVVATFITTPGVNTSNVSSITETSAQGGGEVTSDGGAEVTERGVCLSTSQNPTKSDSCTSDGSGTGSYTSSLNQLKEGTTYYVRAYASNQAGTAYGNQVSFVTKKPVSVPTVATSGISSVTTNSAQGGGNVTDNGGINVTQRGVCWSTLQNPTTANSCTFNGAGTGAYSSSISGLSAGTTYYVRAYAINGQGTAYGNQRSFKTETGGTSGSTVTDIDGNVYPVVQIGSQKWFASNLRTTRYSTGAGITNVTNANQWRNLNSGAWAYYDNNSAHNAVYGKLYNWFAAADASGICPAGWRVPSDNDWKVLEAALGMPQSELNSLYHRGSAQNVGSKMKTTGNTHWRVPISDPSHKYYNPNFVPATNSSGFSGVPNGSLNALDATHSGPGFYSMFRDQDLWSATAQGGNAYIRALSFNQTSIYRDTRSKKFGLAIRCVQ